MSIRLTAWLALNHNRSTCPQIFLQKALYRPNRYCQAHIRPGDHIGADYPIWDLNDLTAHHPNSRPSEPIIVFVHLINEAGEWVAGWDQLNVAHENWQTGDFIGITYDLQTKVVNQTASGQIFLDCKTGFTHTSIFFKI